MYGLKVVWELGKRTGIRHFGCNGCNDETGCWRSPMRLPRESPWSSQRAKGCQVQQVIETHLPKRIYR